MTKFSKKEPRKEGQVKTSAPVMTIAKPKRPKSQGGQLVGGMRANFGVGSATMKGKGNSSGPKRSKMY